MKRAWAVVGLVAVPALLFAGLWSATKAFTAVGGGPRLNVKSGKSMTYTVSGSTQGLVDVQRTLDGGQTFQTVVSDIRAPLAGSTSGTIFVETPSGDRASYRVYCSTIVTGTITAVLQEASEAFEEFRSPANEVLLTLKNDAVVLGASTADAVTFVGIPTIPSDAAPRTNITPPAANSLIRNSTSGAVCLSTGTTASTWVVLTATTTACN